MDEERREFFRVMVRLPVRCLAVAADGSASLMMVRSVDLSAGGVCVVTDRTLRPGDGVRLAFEVADGTPFKLEGHVVRADRLRDGMHRYGLEFAELDLATEQRMFKAVFEQEQVNAGRHEHVRMTVWEPVTCRLDGEPHGFPGPRAPALGRRRSRSSPAGRCRWASGCGWRWTTPASGSGSTPTPRWPTCSRTAAAAHVATLAFDGLDRVTRSSILRRAMEQERRERAGE